MTLAGSSRIGLGTATPVAAATAVVLREPALGTSGQGMEVLLQERVLRADFAGGALVFPGGKADAQDVSLAPALRLGVDDVMLRRRLGTQTRAGALALVVAAVRETFEEAGVLFARRGGEVVDEDFLAQDHALRMRASLADRDADADWRPWLAAHDLRLDVGALVPFAWWITPHGVRRRFSTRFFVARVPDCQAHAAGHDGTEMTDTVWLSPEDALTASERGDRTVIYPTRRTLAALAAHDSVEGVMRAARDGAVDLRPIVPLLRPGPTGPGVQHPDGGPVEAV